MAFRMLHQSISGSGSGPCGEAGAAPNAEAADATAMAPLILGNSWILASRKGCQQGPNGLSQRWLRNVQHICHCLLSLPSAELQVRALGCGGDLHPIT